ncbi:MAG: L-seryl-tRNA(Sec) selenium transferase [Pseudomonadota bacterium]
MSAADTKVTQERLRALPSIGELLQQPAIAALAPRLGHDALTQLLRDAVEQTRHRILEGEDASLDLVDIVEHATRSARDSLRPVLNATGVVVHTNLGRAPLAGVAIEALLAVARGYSTLEYDLAAGSRGSRHHHATALLAELTGAEDAAVVNNNAAAVLLALSALATGREVVVSRGELVEIGGGFRIPDVMRQSGALLVEVGTTNRTHREDYARALGEHSALVLKVHRSNFAVVGFTAEVSLPELSSLAKAHGLPLMYDAGSGCLRSLDALAGEPTVARAVAEGTDLVTFSGDKLLGGPQAGLLVGRAEWIQRIRQHPLMRALRPDKLCLAALVATLRLWRDDPLLVPVARAISTPTPVLQRRAEVMAAALVAARPGLNAQACACVDRVGGGASPLTELPGWAVRVEGVDEDGLARVLRDHDPPVIGRVADGALWIHPRTLALEHDDIVIEALLSGISAPDASGDPGSH